MQNVQGHEMVFRIKLFRTYEFSILGTTRAVQQLIAQLKLTIKAKFFHQLRLIEANGQLRGTAMPPGEKKKHSQRELVES